MMFLSLLAVLMLSGASVSGVLGAENTVSLEVSEIQENSKKGFERLCIDNILKLKGLNKEEFKIILEVYLEKNALKIWENFIEQVSQFFKKNPKVLEDHNAFLLEKFEEYKDSNPQSACAIIDLLRTAPNVFPQWENILFDLLDNKNFQKRILWVLQQPVKLVKDWSSQLINLWSGNKSRRDIWSVLAQHRNIISEQWKTLLLETFSQSSDSSLKDNILFLFQQYPELVDDQWEDFFLEVLKGEKIANQYRVETALKNRPDIISKVKWQKLLLELFKDKGNWLAAYIFLEIKPSEINKGFLKEFQEAVWNHIGQRIEEVVANGISYDEYKGQRIDFLKAYLSSPLVDSASLPQWNTVMKKLFHLTYSYGHIYGDRWSYLKGIIEILRSTPTLVDDEWRQNLAMIWNGGGETMVWNGQNHTIFHYHQNQFNNDTELLRKIQTLAQAGGWSNRLNYRADMNEGAILDENARYAQSEAVMNIEATDYYNDAAKRFHLEGLEKEIGSDIEGYMKHYLDDVDSTLKNDVSHQWNRLGKELSKGPRIQKILISVLQNEKDPQKRKKNIKSFLEKYGKTAKESHPEKKEGNQESCAIGLEGFAIYALFDELSLDKDGYDPKDEIDPAAVFYLGSAHYNALLRSGAMQGLQVKIVQEFEKALKEEKTSDLLTKLQGIRGSQKEMNIWQALESVSEGTGLINVFRFLEKSQDAIWTEIKKTLEKEIERFKNEEKYNLQIKRDFKIYQRFHELYLNMRDIVGINEKKNLVANFTMPTGIYSEEDFNELRKNAAENVEVIESIKKQSFIMPKDALNLEGELTDREKILAQNFLKRIQYVVDHFPPGKTNLEVYIEKLPDEELVEALKNDLTIEGYAEKIATQIGEQKELFDEIDPKSDSDKGRLTRVLERKLQGKGDVQAVLDRFVNNIIAKLRRKKEPSKNSENDQNANPSFNESSPETGSPPLPEFLEIHYNGKKLDDLSDRKAWKRLSLLADMVGDGTLVYPSKHKQSITYKVGFEGKNCFTLHVTKDPKVTETHIKIKTTTGKEQLIPLSNAIVKVDYGNGLTDWKYNTFQTDVEAKCPGAFEKLQEFWGAFAAIKEPEKRGHKGKDHPFEESKEPDSPPQEIRKRKDSIDSVKSDQSEEKGAPELTVDLFQEQNNERRQALQKALEEAKNKSKIDAFPEALAKLIKEQNLFNDNRERALEYLKKSTRTYLEKGGQELSRADKMATAALKKAWPAS